MDMSAVVQFMVTENVREFGCGMDALQVRKTPDSTTISPSGSCVISISGTGAEHKVKALRY